MNHDQFKRLQAAQEVWDKHDGSTDSKAVVTELEAARPRGYIAEHGNDQCRVILGDQCLTPIKAIDEPDAIELAIQNNIQLAVRYHLSTRKWFLTNLNSEGLPKKRNQ